MIEHGVRFQPSLGGTLHVSRTNAFFLGGGKALVNAYYRAAEALGVEISYDAEVTDLDIDDGRFRSAQRRPRRESAHEIRAQAVVAAAGGFESNLDWLREAWGPVADNFLIRGTPYNMGRVLRVLLDAGAQSDRRSDAGPLRRDRRARAEVRRRHLHAGRLRVARHRRQRERPALLRRGRGFLAEALRDLGPPGRGPAEPDRLLDHRRQDRWASSCRRSFRR